jgi:hypothetical protein
VNYDYLAKDHDFIQVTEWSNEEGFDITINEQIYSFTGGQINAMFHLKNHLTYHDEN